MPEGNFSCITNGKYYKWFCSINSKQTYIPKSQKTQAQKLAYKHYLSLQLSFLNQELQATNAYLNTPKEPASPLLSQSGYQELLSAFIPSPEIQEWINIPYPKNSAHPETLLYKAPSGNLVRSKSEVLIDLALTRRNIPFRYECALELNETTLFPDFTILHPETQEIIYWEHFGMMDKATYSQNAFSKLQFYTSNGLVPSINLITTFETKEHPLTLETIDQMLEIYFPLQY